MSSFIKKIQKNFELSLQQYDKKSKSRYWKNSIDKKKNLFKKNHLKNFRSNSLSKNIDDFYLKEKEIKNLYLNLKNKTGEKFLEKFLSSKNIGNPKRYIKIKKKFITASDLFHINYLFEVSKKIKLQKIISICEIGQGFGLFASKLLKIKNYKMILIDLPESNFITSYFLKKKFPKKKIIMDIDLPKKKLTKEILIRGDIFIISPWVNIGEIKIDFFINSRSMMEMNYSSINGYFNLIQNKITNNGYFLCINRYYKDLVGYPVEFHKYPYRNNWKIIISKSSWMQKHIHFLLVKKVSPQLSDIKAELQKIKKNYLRIVKQDKFFWRRWLPVSIYRNYKIIKNLITNK